MNVRQIPEAKDIHIVYVGERRYTRTSDKTIACAKGVKQMFVIEQSKENCDILMRDLIIMGEPG